MLTEPLREGKAFNPDKFSQEDFLFDGQRDDFVTNTSTSKPYLNFDSKWLRTTEAENKFDTLN